MSEKSFQLCDIYAAVEYNLSLVIVYASNHSKLLVMRLQWFSADQVSNVWDMELRFCTASICNYRYPL